MIPDARVIKSYVWHKGKCFFVSTIERDSSALFYNHRYNETLVWKYDWENRERGELVGQGEGLKGTIQNHLKICERIYFTGKVEEEET